MRFSRETIGTLLTAGIAIVGGGYLSKVDATAGQALIAIGGLLVGWLGKQPGFAARE